MLILHRKDFSFFNQANSELNSSVGVVTRPRAWWPTKIRSIPGKNRTLSCSPKRPKGVWGPPTLLFTGYVGLPYYSPCHSLLHRHEMRTESVSAVDNSRVCASLCVLQRLLQSQYLPVATFIRFSTQSYKLSTNFCSTKQATLLMESSVHRRLWYSSLREGQGSIPALTQHN